jgi:pimeloyl-ACP methyl ester carboxylesterase
MEQVEVAGLRIAYRRAGDGPALVLLHGALSDSRAWRPQLDGLSDEVTVVAWDAPGCGQSADPPSTFFIAGGRSSSRQQPCRAMKTCTHMPRRARAGLVCHRELSSKSSRALALVQRGQSWTLRRNRRTS